MELLELKAESEDAIRNHKEAQAELDGLGMKIVLCLKNLRDIDIEYYEKSSKGTFWTTL
jgi:hypothetical protein